MQVVLRRVFLVLSVVMLLGSAAAAPSSNVGLSAAQGLTVYVLRGGDAASDSAVVDALRAAGMTVTEGAETPEFSGTEAELSQFDAVVVLYNRNVTRSLAPAGVAALVEYVQSGGGLISGEWLIWQSAAQNYTNLSALLPATNCGIQTASNTTFRQLTPNPVINRGLPAQFSLNLSNFSGSQSCLAAKPDAAVLYANNYPGRADAVGLAAWNPPGTAGRVASFATLLSAAELAVPAGRTLLQNTVTWVAAGEDLTPPTIEDLSVSGAGTIGGSRDLTISLQASDRGGAQIGMILLVEYVYSNDAQDSWRVVQRSGWQPYGSAATAVFDWQLSADPGVHYLQVFVSDRAGNISASPDLEFVSVQSGAVAVAEAEVKLYRIAPAAGATVTVQMDVLSGNPDLYVFGGNATFAEGLDTAQETFTFTADGGIYQIEVEGYQSGTYQLSVNGGGVRALLEGSGLDTRRRSSIITLSAFTPGVEDAELTSPPAIVGPAALGRVMYLPLVVGGAE